MGVSDPNTAPAIVVYPALADAPSIAAVKEELESFICILNFVALTEELKISFLIFICLKTEIFVSADDELTNAVVLL